MAMAVIDICLLCYAISLDTLLLACVSTHTVFAGPFSYLYCKVFLLDSDTFIVKIITAHS